MISVGTARADGFSNRLPSGVRRVLIGKRR